MSRNIAPFGVRMPPELKDKVEKAAKTAGRSINAEIIHRLQQSFEAEQQPEIIRLDEARRASHSEYTELREKFDEMLTKMDKLLKKTDD
ncbi:MAG: Arc family DNA-binding protein [Candidatus Oceanisphaera merdipullorum]|nr:Arc family DNA-binding protein [Candidatus Oceanisphaera merdipullorum]